MNAAGEENWEEVGKWIRRRRLELGFGRREDLAARTRLGLSTILRIENASEPTRAPTRATLATLARELGVDPPGLLYDWGAGQISKRRFLAAVGSPDDEEADEKLEHEARRVVLSMPPKPFEATKEGTAILGEVTAGGLVESRVFEAGERPERVPIHYPGHRVYALRIKGDSMAPEYRAGEILVVEDVPVDELVDGEDAVLQLDGSHGGASTFKRLIIMGGGRIKLLPLNPNFKATDVPMESVVRAGRVLGIYRQRNPRMRFMGDV